MSNYKISFRLPSTLSACRPTRQDTSDQGDAPRGTGPESTATPACTYRHSHRASRRETMRIRQ